MMIQPKPDTIQYAAAMSQRSPVDLWIGQALKQSYNETLREPVPENLTRLLQDFPCRG